MRPACRPPPPAAPCRKQGKDFPLNFRPILAACPMYARTDPPQPERRVAPRRGIPTPPPGMDRRDGTTPNKSVSQFQTFFLSELVLHYSKAPWDAFTVRLLGESVSARGAESVAYTASICILWCQVNCFNP